MVVAVGVEELNKIEDALRHGNVVATTLR